MIAANASLAQLLAAYVPLSEAEARDVARIHRLAASGADPWTRASLLHVTGSAMIVHPPTRRVLLRWHERMQSWLQVGGHADPGEIDPFMTALREAGEETGLTDLQPWPDRVVPRIVHIAVVPVPAGKGEPVHEHADVRYALATSTPDAVVPENEGAQLRWLSVPEALEAVGEDNLRVCLTRIAVLFGD
jgi:8-oxo-dGTP pyrophosphatase MutT (NUDIX family)